MTHNINVPKPFPMDTPEQQAQAMLNYFTHRFAANDGEIRCVECDCRTTHKASFYPCGEEPPRILRTFGDDNKIISEVEICFICIAEVNLDDEGGHIYPDGCVVCASCEGKTFKDV